MARMQIDGRDGVQRLLDDGVSEGRTLDYKEQLPLSKDEEKREFLNDVSSLANALGGELIVGLSELRDASGKPTGIPSNAVGISIENRDAFRLKMENLLRDGIQPRIAAVRFEFVPGYPQGEIIIIHVARSLSGPHMVTYQGSSRFYGRNSAGKYPLDVLEIRKEMLESSLIAERPRLFRNERLLRLNSDESPILAISQPKLVLHIIPIRSGLNEGGQHPIDSNDKRLTTIRGERALVRRNLDGLLVTDSRRRNLTRSYLQVFRNGALEVVDTTVFEDPIHPNAIQQARLEQALLVSLEAYRTYLSDSDIVPPLVIYVTILGAKDWFIPPPGRFPPDNPTRLDRDTIHLPDVFVDSENQKQPSDVLLRPIFDILWEASGYERDEYYMSDGRWSHGDWTLPRSG